MIRLAVQVLLFLKQALFHGLDFPPLLLDLVFPIHLGLENGILGLDLGLLANGFGLHFGRLDNLVGCQPGIGHAGLGQFVAQQKTQSCASGQSQ